MVLSVSPHPYPRAVTSCLDQIASDLGQDPNLLRLKKLLFYVCTETWETDYQRLERLSLRVLLQHLLEISPTFEAFQQKVNQAAARLNKSAEYIILANVVTSRFAVVYAELHQEQLAPARQEVYWAVVQLLSAQTAADQLRIKKLMLLTCRGTWENGADQLEALSLPELVRELHQIAPTAEALKTTLNQVAQALSKPEAYSQVAHTISMAFERLYPADLTVTEPNTALDLSELNLASNPVANSPVANSSVANPAHLSTLPNSDLASLPSLTAEQATQTMLRIVKRSVPDSGSRAGSKPSSKPTKPGSKLPSRMLGGLAAQAQTVDLFDLRLEIMQDSNPYRVKILLFSLLHEPFQGDADHEALLKTHELDDLLRILFLSYRQYVELDGRLRRVAAALAKDEYSQAATALLRAVQPYYMTACTTIEPLDIKPLGSEANLAEITNMKSDNHEITLPD